RERRLREASGYLCTAGFPGGKRTLWSTLMITLPRRASTSTRLVVAAIGFVWLSRVMRAFSTLILWPGIETTAAPPWVTMAGGPARKAHGGAVIDGGIGDDAPDAGLGEGPFDKGTHHLGCVAVALIFREDGVADFHGAVARRAREAGAAGEERPLGPRVDRHA